MCNKQSIVENSVFVGVLIVLVAATIPAAEAAGNETRILLWWPTHLLIYLPNHTNCNSVRIETKAESDIFHNSLKAIWSNGTRTLPAASPPLSSHAVRCGPGWVELRFPVPRAARPTLLGYAVSYKGRGARAALDVGRVDDRTLEPRSLPVHPCPSWGREAKFCILLTDLLRWPTPDGEKHIYKFQIRSHYLLQPELDAVPVKVGRESDGYTFFSGTCSCDVRRMDCAIPGTARGTLRNGNDSRGKGATDSDLRHNKEWRPRNLDQSEAQELEQQGRIKRERGQGHQRKTRDERGIGKEKKNEQLSPSTGPKREISVESRGGLSGGRRGDTSGDKSGDTSGDTSEAKDEANTWNKEQPAKKPKQKKPAKQTQKQETTQERKETTEPKEKEEAKQTEKQNTSQERKETMKSNEKDEEKQTKKAKTKKKLKKMKTKEKDEEILAKKQKIKEKLKMKSKEKDEEKLTKKPKTTQDRNETTEPKEIEEAKPTEKQNTSQERKETMKSNKKEEAKQTKKQNTSQERKKTIKPKKIKKVKQTKKAKMTQKRKKTNSNTTQKRKDTAEAQKEAEDTTERQATKELSRDVELTTGRPRLEANVRNRNKFNYTDPADTVSSVMNTRTRTLCLLFIVTWLLLLIL